MIVEEKVSTPSNYIFNLMRSALAALQKREASRENSVAITQLETAMMWHNKDRGNKGELEVSETHV